MGGLFHSPKTTKIPPPPDPVPVPEPELITDAGEFEKKKSRRRSGRRKTIVTGDLAPTPSKRTLLG